MSAKVSTASSASPSPNPGANAGGSAGAALAAGNVAAGSGGIGGPGGSRRSSGPASGSGSGPGSTPESIPRFSSAMAEAAQADGQADDCASEPSGATTGPGTTDGTAGSAVSADCRTRTAAAGNSRAANAAAASGAPPRTPQPGTPSLSTPTLSTSPFSATARADSRGGAHANLAAPDQVDAAPGGNGSVKSGGGARTDGVTPGSPPPNDPVALAMLIAASGLQVGAGAAAGGARDDPGSAAASAADSKSTAIVASGVAQAAPMQAAALPDRADPLAAAASGAPSPAPADAPALREASRGALPDAPVPVPAKAANPDTPPVQPPGVSSPAGLSDLARSLAPAPSPPVTQGAIALPVSDPNWPHAMASQVHWFVNHDVQSATLRVSPEHLGPIEVHIDVRQAQVNVSFHATHAETRAALEQTVPRLREIFASSGLTLGQTNVQQDPRPGSQSAAPMRRPGFADAQTVEPVAVTTAHAPGLVDEYV